jgi:hypothetical protein
MELTVKTIDTVSLPEGKSELVVFDEKIGIWHSHPCWRQPNILLSIPHEPVR